MLLKWAILDMFHMQELSSSDKYLGLPVLLGHSQHEALSIVEQRIHTKTQSRK